MKPCVWLVAVGLLGLTACTETGWVKAGVTDEEFIADSEDCAEIARRQARRDYSLFRFRTTFSRSYRYDRYGSRFRDFGPTLSELEFRYRHVCMISKGYELAPLDEEPSG